MSGAWPEFPFTESVMADYTSVVTVETTTGPDVRLLLGYHGRTVVSSI